MRFLIGIIIGAILTLFIATAVDAPTHPALERARVGLERLWDSLIDTTSDSLFQAEGDASPSKPPSSDSDPAASPFQPATALEAPADMPPALPADALAEAPVNSLVAEAITEADEIAGVADDAFESLPPFESLPRFESAPANEPGGFPAGQELAAVWVPFHSQMSAEGFAARLSQELDHAFRVERQAAGAYQVVFDAGSIAERDLVLAQIAEITGQ